MNHNIVKTGAAYRCTVCGWTWARNPQSACPGVTRYAWGTAPKNLMTVGQLKELKLKPAAARGVVQSTNGEYFLYDQAEAVPFAAEEIATQKEYARRYRLGLKTRKERELKREQERQAEYEAMITRARDGAIAWARDLVAHPEEWVILDTETTGLDSDDEVIQIAILAPAGQILLDELVNPISEISYEAEQVHGISMAMLADKPTVVDLAPRLAELLPAGKKIVAYNASFDCRLLWQSLSRHEAKGFDPFGYVWHDAMAAYSRYYGEWSDYWHDFKWQRLWGGDHTASGDCRATLELIERMAASKLSSEVSNATP